MLQDGDFENRALSAISLRQGGNGADAPAHLNGVGRGRVCQPDQYDRDSGFLRRKLQSSAGRQIDGADGFEDDGAQCRTTCSFESGAQGLCLRAHAGDDETGWREPQRSEARAIGISRFCRNGGFAHPKHRGVVRRRCERLGHECQAEAYSGAGLSRPRNDLMQDGMSWARAG